MNKFNPDTIGFLFKSIIFSLLVAASWTSVAQESLEEVNDSNTVIEQVNINEADAATIARVLDGIGITRANAIVDFRKEFGDFTSLEDLQLVSGVGEITLRNNEERINFD